LRRQRFYFSPRSLDSYARIRLALSKGERIEVRGFEIAACSDATLTLTLSLEKGEANGATPLQLIASAKGVAFNIEPGTMYQDVWNA